MCLGNRAHASISYFNAQLGVLYKNAKDCSDKYNVVFKPDRREIEYGTCLYKFFGSPKVASANSTNPNDLDCWFVFAEAPLLDFICDHEAVIQIVIESGRFSSSNAGTEAHIRRQQESTSINDKIKVTIRLNYHVRYVDHINDEYIGARTHKLGLCVLDFDTIELADRETVPAGLHSDAYSSLFGCLKNDYFAFLRRAGHHVLHCLPDFQEESISSHVDYLGMSELHAYCWPFTVKMEIVNEFLYERLLKAFNYTEKYDTYEEYGSETESVFNHYQAEYRGEIIKNDGESISLHIHFQSQTVQALCEREFIFCINIEEANVYTSNGFKEAPIHRFANCKIAFVVDIEEGAITISNTQISFQPASSRFCSQFSQFSESDHNDTLTHWRVILIEFIQNNYFSVMTSVQHTTIYDSNDPISMLPSPVSSAEKRGEGSDIDDSTGRQETGCTCNSYDLCSHKDEERESDTPFIRWAILEKLRLQKFTTYGYDNILAVTQYSINSSLQKAWDQERARADKMTVEARKNLWRTSADLNQRICLVEYSVPRPGTGDDLFFDAKFKPLQLQIVIDKNDKGRLGNGRVILHLTITKGFLTLLGPKGEPNQSGQKHSFEKWRIAYSIDIKLRDDYMKNKELVLDFATAKFNKKLSRLTDNDRRNLDTNIRKNREAILFYLEKHYFKTIASMGYDVLFSNLGNTISTFQTYPFMFPDADADADNEMQYKEGLRGKCELIYARNSILFLKMASSGSSPKSEYIRHDDRNLVVGAIGEIPEGVEAHSRDTFLNRHILKALVSINRNSTLLCSVKARRGMEPIVELMTWDKCDMTEQQNWREVTKDGTERSSLDFEWRISDNFNHECKMFDVVDNTFSVECTTKNMLIIPIQKSEEALRIHIRGKFELILSNEGANEILSWKSEIPLAVTWEAIISLESDEQGNMKAKTPPVKVTPEFSSAPPKSGPGADTMNKVYNQLKTQFPKVIEIESIVRELNQSLSGAFTEVRSGATQAWATKPAFSQHGDLLVDFKFKQIQASSSPRNNPPPAYASDAKTTISRRLGVSNMSSRVRTD